MMDKKHDKILSTAAEGKVIHILNLRKSFDGNDVLKDINLNVNKGETLITLGKSGSGKSVLLKCIVRLIEPDGGSINVLGEDIISLSPSELMSIRRNIGFIFQSSALYDSMSVRENLKFPLVRHFKLSKTEIEERVIDVLENVGLKEAIDKMPSELSGGMRKRIGLARTLILRPEIMLYDEPTTGLDPATSREISSLIRQMQEKYNVTSIVVTHDMECVQITADRIVVLQDGTFTHSGTYQELQKSNDEFVSSFFT
ncbi:MAG: ATP-binding cassette domain-containing protein [Ignavibacteria bacterium]|jgi:phospholipid/cholesterol/gamma-HCH transport system ATP-binding protein